jgi:protein TonB
MLAGGISLGLHGALLIGVLLWSRAAPPRIDAPETPGTVELVLEEHQGPRTASAPPRAEPSPGVPAPAREPASSDVAMAEHMPPPAPAQHTQEAPEISIAGNDDETNAIVIGPRVIPASIDAKSRNLEPVYPREAALLAEQGAVILVIHVSADGVAAGVDVAQSSGFGLLDRAARDAVLRWHFLPAVRDGRPIPFDMALRVVFHLD